MICKSIEVEQFRNIEHARVDFTPGVNVLIGNNAQGKTNLLEALAFSALGKSFRGARDADLIRFSQKQSSIDLVYFDGVRDTSLKTLLFDTKKKRVEQNGLAVKRMSEIVGGLRVVLFCPEHLSLVKDGPDERRTFLDMAISQLKPVYLASLQRYNKILKERNRLLKMASESEKERKTMEQTIEVWSAQLAREGALLAKYRVRYVKKLSQEIRGVFRDMTGAREIPTLSYLGSCYFEDESEYEDQEQTEKALFSLLCRSQAREMLLGRTLYGMHRDDVLIGLNGKEARLFASQGQQRSLSLAMKLGEGEISRQTCGDYPVFLFDDVLSELDGERRKYLTESIKDKQVIMTTCELLEQEQKLLQNASVTRVENGVFTKL